MVWLRRRAGVQQFVVSDELVLTANPGAGSNRFESAETALALNASGKAIWLLCDGKRSRDDIVTLLSVQYHAESSQIERDVDQTIARLIERGFLEEAAEPLQGGAGRLFVVAIEDTTYFHWQLAIFLESFRGKLPVGWRTLVVVCNDGASFSSDLRRTLAAYQTEVATTTNYSKHRAVDIGHSQNEHYGPLNRIEALAVAASFVTDQDVICLIDCDIFLYRRLRPEILPNGCALPYNWHVAHEKFFSSIAANHAGIDLQELLSILGCDREFKPGGVNIFVTGAVAKNEKFIADCFRFAQVLFLLGRIRGIELVWIAEMACFALSMTANGIEYSLTNIPELSVPSCDEPDIPEGSLYHYYSDPADFGRGGFHASPWFKQAYRRENFLRSDYRIFLDRAQSGECSPHEAYFFELAEAARKRVYMYQTPNRLRYNQKAEGEVPSLGLGFRKISLPGKLHELLLTHLEKHRHDFRSEPANDYVRTENSKAHPSLLYQDEEFNQKLLSILQPDHEEWAGRPLKKAACYGIRAYQPGSYLLNHRDRVNTHVVSATICVDHALSAPWPLYIEDFDGNPHEVAVEPGEMVFFEGARLVHGRPYPLIGEYYANIFVHYTPLDWAPATERS